MIRLFERLRSKAVLFGRARAGNFAITFALMLVPIFGAVGTAVDYSKANKARSQLQAAADAASLAAIAKASVGFSTAINMANNGSIQEAEDDAVGVFNSTLENKGGFNVTQVNASVNKYGQNLTATIDFTATVPSSFMMLFGIQSVPITGSSRAVLRVPVFIDFYLLLDNSPSMGVAATPADIDTMVA